METNKNKLIVESEGIKIEVQLPLDADIFQWMDAFKTVMIGITFSESQFGNWLVEYCKENGYINENNNS